jgi:uncharacterized membrane protein YdjX (TVP38/TMEM64 family)
MKARPGFRKKWFLAIVACLGFALSWHFIPIDKWLAAALAWISELGNWGPVIFVLLYAIACVCFFPGSILTIGAGVVFGLVRGFVLVSIASVLGAVASFLIGRHLARGWVARKLSDYPRFQAIDEAVAAEGWKIVFLMRLSPVFPFNLLNYAFGLTRVSLRDYTVASWIGMIPGTILFVYVGSLAGSLANLGSPSRPRTRADWAFSLIGIIATLGVTIFVTRLARKALNLKLTE